MLPLPAVLDLLVVQLTGLCLQAVIQAHRIIESFRLENDL